MGCGVCTKTKDPEKTRRRVAGAHRTKKNNRATRGSRSSTEMEPARVSCPEPEVVKPRKPEGKEDETCPKNISEGKREERKAIPHAYENAAPVVEKPTIQLFTFNPECFHKKTKLYEIRYTSFPYASPSDSTHWDNSLKLDNDSDRSGQMFRILSLDPRDWYQELSAAQESAVDSSELPYASWQASQRLREHFNWLAWAVCWYRCRSHGAEVSQLATPLPPTNSNDWVSGFVWKGVFVKLLNGEEKSCAKNELNAQKYVAIELMEIKGHNLMLPLIATANFGTESLLISACIYAKQNSSEDLLAKEESSPSCSILSESKIQLSCCIENSSTATLESAFKDKPILSHLAQTNLVSLSSIHTLFVVINANSILPETNPYPYCFMGVPQDPTEVFEVHPDIVQTKFGALTLAALMGGDVAGHDANERKASQIFQQNSQLDHATIFGWDLHFLSQSNNDLLNKRANDILNASQNTRKVKGPALLGCYYCAHGTKAKYSMIPFCAASTLRTIKASVEQAAKELDNNGLRCTFPCVKSTMHKYGLNVRYEWIIAREVKDANVKEIIRNDIILRAAKKTVSAHANVAESYIATIIEYLNNTLKGEISSEMRYAVFFSRLKLALNHDPQLLELADSIQDVLDSAGKNPRLLLEGAEYHFGVRFCDEFMQNIVSDTYYIRRDMLKTSLISDIELSVKCPMSTREHCYTVLANLISLPESHQKLALSRDYTTQKEEDSESSVVASENYHTRRDKLPNKKVGDCLTKMVLGQNCRSERRKVLVERLLLNEGRRGCNCRHLTANLPLPSLGPKFIRNSNSLAKKKCVPVFLPTTIPFPSDLYTIEEEGAGEKVCMKSSPASFLKKSYSLPRVAILGEWEEYTKTLAEGLPAVDGSESVLFESQILLMISELCRSCGSSTLCSECRGHSEFMVRSIGDGLQKMIENFSVCEPETVLTALSLFGIMLEYNQRNSDAIKTYTESIALYISVYGDPRGRGSRAHEWGAILVKRLKWLVDKEKGILDSEFLNELGEAIDRRYCCGKNCARGDLLAKSVAELAADVLSAGKDKRVDHGEVLDWMRCNYPYENPSGMMWRNNDVKELFKRCLGEKQVMSYSSSKSSQCSAEEVKQSSCGGRNTCWEAFFYEYNSAHILRLNGRLFLWGTNRDSELGTPIGSDPIPSPRLCVSLKDEYIVDVVCGHCCSFAINVRGELFSWGNNQFGQLGLGEEAPSVVEFPSLVQGLPPVRAVSVGNEHAAAVCRSGQIFTWGNGDSGLLGRGNVKSSPKPEEIPSLKGKDVLQIECGGLHTFVVTSKGEIFGWGRAEGGQLGLSQDELAKLLQEKGDYYMSEPRQIGAEVFGLKKVISVACGEAHTLAVTDTEEVFGWGFCNFGQLGLGFTSDSFEPGTGNYKSTVWTPSKISALEGSHITKVVAGSTFSFFISSDGDIYSCGVNDFAQTGNEIELRDIHIEYSSIQRTVKTSDVSLPTKLLCFTKMPVVSVSAGENHALALTQDPDSIVWTWGKTAEADWTAIKNPRNLTPRPVRHLAGVKLSKVACGSTHSAVLGEVEHGVVQ